MQATKLTLITNRCRMSEIGNIVSNGEQKRNMPGLTAIQMAQSREKAQNQRSISNAWIRFENGNDRQQLMPQHDGVVPEIES